MKLLKRHESRYIKRHTPRPNWIWRYRFRVKGDELEVSFEKFLNEDKPKEFKLTKPQKSTDISYFWAVS